MSIQQVQDATSSRNASRAPSDVAFPLRHSYELKGVVFDEIALRPPRGHEFWEIGEIDEWQVAGELPVRITNYAVIRAYAERCASVPGETGITGPAIVEVLDLDDAIALRKAVTRFFRVPEEEASA